MSREQLLSAIAAHNRKASGWRSPTSGYACDSADGHAPAEDTVVERAESRMAEPDVCIHCGRRIVWAPRNG